MSRLRSLALVLFVAVVPTSYGGGPTAVLADAVGLYVLEGDSGSGLPARGSIVLRPDGSAARRVRYDVPGGGPIDVALDGRFEARDGEVTLRLNEPMGAEMHVWEVRGELDGQHLVLTYPNPADGTIVERYRRLSVRL